MRALLRPSGGEALVEGAPPVAMRDPLRTVGAALEATAFHPGRSGRNHLRTLAVAAGIPGSRVEEVLEMVELQGAAGRRVKGYSLGMRQRLALAAALLGEPPRPRRLDGRPRRPRHDPGLPPRRRGVAQFRRLSPRKPGVNPTTL
jgi:ABC-type multidrug transport system ATPase subunit